MLLARADFETLLRDRKLIPPVALGSNTDEYATAPTGITALDARLGGGFPRGQLSEIVGARSSGRMGLLPALWRRIHDTADRVHHLRPAVLLA